MRIISENPSVSIDEMRISLDVTDRTIARYVSELKEAQIIETIRCTVPLRRLRIHMKENKEKVSKEKLRDKKELRE